MGLGTAVVGVVAIAVSTVQMAWPASVRVKQVAAVSVHAASAKRVDAGLALVDRSRAGAVVSDVGEGYGRSSAAMVRLCARRQPYEVGLRAPEAGQHARWESHARSGG